MFRTVQGRTTAVLALVVGVLILILSRQYDTVREQADTIADFKQAVYVECLERREFDMAANIAREVEVREFRRLGELALQNAALNGGQRQARQESYNAMAEALTTAVSKQVSADCSGKKP